MKSMALQDLQTIAQMLDRFIEEHGNSYALEQAAVRIAEELEDRDVTVTRVLVRYELYVDVKHSKNAGSSAVNVAAIDFARDRVDYSGEWECEDVDTDDELLGFEDTEVE